MPATVPDLDDAHQTVWCLVGNRIGPDCLAIALAESPRSRFIISPTERAEPDLVQQVVDGARATNCVIQDFRRVARDVSSGGIQVDWLLNLWGERIVPASLLGLVGDSVNIHPSFLPYGRGSDPIPWAIIQGDPAGASLHRMTEELDGGAIWCQRQVEYDFPEAGHSLYEKVLQECVHLFQENWPLIRAEKIAALDQSTMGQPVRKRAELLAARRLDQEQLLGMSAMDLVRRALALDFGDDFCLVLDLNGKEIPLRLDLLSANSRVMP